MGRFPDVNVDGGIIPKRETGERERERKFRDQMRGWGVEFWLK